MAEHTLTIDAGNLVDRSALPDATYRITGWPRASSDANGVYVGAVAVSGTLDANGEATVDLPPSLTDDDGEAITWLVFEIDGYEPRFPFTMPNEAAVLGQRVSLFGTPPGKVGPTKGDTGVGVQSFSYVAPNLTVTLTDGTTQGPFAVRGDAGVGIASVQYADPNLTVTLTDGTTAGPFDIKGEPGTDGVGIVSIVENDDSTELTVTLTDGTVQNFNISAGPRGVGIQSTSYVAPNLTIELTDGTTEGPYDVRGGQGIQGLRGIGIQSVAYESPNLRITLTDETVVGPFNIRGTDGDDGDDGVGIASASYVAPNLTLTMTDGSTQGPFNIRGTDGIDGTDGVGIASAAYADPNLTLTLTDGSTQGPFDVKGDKGDKGDQGDRGLSGVPGAYRFWQHESLTDPNVTANTAQQRTHSYQLYSGTITGGIEASIPFSTQYEGILQLDFDSTADGSNNATFEIEIVTRHVIGTVQFDSTRTVRVRLNRNDRWAFPLAAFNSVSQVELGSFTDEDGNTFDITQAMLDADVTITVTLNIQLQGSGDSTLDEVRIEDGAVTWSQTGFDSGSTLTEIAWDHVTGKPARLGAFTQADETKLDGIETGAQVNVGVEFTAADHTKLDGIEAGAQVNPATFPYASITGAPTLPAFIYVASASAREALAPDGDTSGDGDVEGHLVYQADTQQFWRMTGRNGADEAIWTEQRTDQPIIDHLALLDDLTGDIHKEAEKAWATVVAADGQMVRDDTISSAPTWANADTAYTNGTKVSSISGLGRRQAISVLFRVPFGTPISQRRFSGRNYQSNIRPATSPPSSRSWDYYVVSLSQFPGGTLTLQKSTDVYQWTGDVTRTAVYAEVKEIIQGASADDDNETITVEASGGGGSTFHWLYPTAAEDDTSGGRPAETVFNLGSGGNVDHVLDKLPGLNAVDGDFVAFRGKSSRDTGNDYIWVYQLVSGRWTSLQYLAAELTGVNILDPNDALFKVSRTTARGSHAEAVANFSETGWKGDWNEATTYLPGDIVRHQATDGRWYVYIAHYESTGIVPESNSSNVWMQLTSHISHANQVPQGANPASALTLFQDGITETVELVDRRARDDIAAIGTSSVVIDVEHPVVPDPVETTHTPNQGALSGTIATVGLRPAADDWVGVDIWSSHSVSLNLAVGTEAVSAVSDAVPATQNKVVWLRVTRSLTAGENLSIVATGSAITEQVTIDTYRVWQTTGSTAEGRDVLGIAADQARASLIPGPQNRTVESWINELRLYELLPASGRAQGRALIIGGDDDPIWSSLNTDHVIATAGFPPGEDSNNLTHWLSYLHERAHWRGIWSAATDYEAGDTVVRDGVIYRCVTAHTAQAWNADYWLAETVSVEGWAQAGGEGIPSSKLPDLSAVFSPTNVTIRYQGDATGADIPLAHVGQNSYAGLISPAEKTAVGTIDDLTARIAALEAAGSGLTTTVTRIDLTASLGSYNDLWFRTTLPWSAFENKLFSFRWPYSYSIPGLRLVRGDFGAPTRVIPDVKLDNRDIGGQQGRDGFADPGDHVTDGTQKYVHCGYWTSLTNPATSDVHEIALAVDSLGNVCLGIENTPSVASGGYIELVTLT